jgi:hypothetical protein
LQGGFKFRRKEATLPAAPLETVIFSKHLRASYHVPPRLSMPNLTRETANDLNRQLNDQRRKTPKTTNFYSTHRNE